MLGQHTRPTSTSLSVSDRTARSWADVVRQSSGSIPRLLSLSAPPRAWRPGYYSFSTSKRGRRCYKCLPRLHVVRHCRDPVTCVACSASGHIARECSASRGAMTDRRQDQYPFFTSSLLRFVAPTQTSPCLPPTQGVPTPVGCEDPLRLLPANCGVAPPSISSPPAPVVSPSAPPERRTRARKHGAGEREQAQLPRVSTRLRAKGGPLFESVLDRAIRLKAKSKGSSFAAAPLPPFRPDELLSMAEWCQLPEEDVRRLAAAARMPEDAPCR
jgi:hypothetical protein